MFIYNYYRKRKNKLISEVITNQYQHKKHKYQDPLNKKIPVIMSYSNEIGTAISEITPKLGTALWAPTFMYLGADIYDKYKNDKDNYNPSAKRALKRAIYQGVTSLIALPTVIYAGQCIISPLGKLDKYGISGNTKEAVYRHTKNVIEQAHGRDLADFEHFKTLILHTLENKINTRKNEKRTKNWIKRVYNKLFTKRYALLDYNKEKLEAFASLNAQKTFDIMTALKHDDRKNVPKKIYRKYKHILPDMKEMYRDGDYAYQATRNALKEYQNSLIFKNKLLKTIGGLITLLICANPVNDFVEKQIMKKFINPKIDQISNNFVNESKMRNIFNNMNNSKFNSESVQTSNLVEKLKTQHGLKSKAAEYQ